MVQFGENHVQASHQSQQWFFSNRKLVSLAHPQFCLDPTASDSLADLSLISEQNVHQELLAIYVDGHVKGSHLLQTLDQCYVTNRLQSDDSIEPDIAIEGSKSGRLLKVIAARQEHVLWTIMSPSQID